MTVVAIAQVLHRTWLRVLKPFQRRAQLPEDVAERMHGWEYSGRFSLYAEAWVLACNCAGLERLVRYCASKLILFVSMGGSAH